MSDREKYEQVCFSLKEKEKEMENMEVETFVYNPNAVELAKQIFDLTQEKMRLEELLNE